MVIDAARALVPRLAGVRWAVSGSAALARHGIDVEPRDLDIVTTAEGAREIARRLGGDAAFSRRGPIRGVLSRVVVEGVEVEILGDVQNLLADGSWSSPPRLDAVESADGIPVLPLGAVEAGYRDLGRDEKADLVAAHRHPGRPEPRGRTLR